MQRPHLPTIQKLRSFARSSSVIVGWLACSKPRRWICYIVILAEMHAQQRTFHDTCANGSCIFNIFQEVRMFLHPWNSERCGTCDISWYRRYVRTVCILWEYAPTAITNLSYRTLKCLEEAGCNKVGVVPVVGFPMKEVGGVAGIYRRHLMWLIVQDNCNYRLTQFTVLCSKSMRLSCNNK